MMEEGGESCFSHSFIISLFFLWHKKKKILAFLLCMCQLKWNKIQLKMLATFCKEKKNRQIANDVQFLSNFIIMMSRHNYNNNYYNYVWPFFFYNTITFTQYSKKFMLGNDSEYQIQCNY